MVIRRILFLMVCFVASASMYAQVALKTNVAMDAMAVPNLGLEVGIGKKLSLDVPVYYNPWEQVMWKIDSRCMISTSHTVYTKEVTIKFIAQPITQFGLYHKQLE